MEISRKIFLKLVSVRIVTMGEELVWKHDPRSIGIMDEEEYFPVIMFGFRVTAYISGPGTSWSGYEVKIQTTDGPSFTVTIEVYNYLNFLPIPITYQYIY